MEAQDFADLVSAHQADCGVELQHHEGVGMVCPACGTVVLSEGPAETVEQQEAGTGVVQPPWEGPPDPALGKGMELANPWDPQMPVIDLSKITTPREVSEYIADTVGRLERGLVYAAGAIQEYQESARTFKLAHARAIGKAEGRAADQREAEALLATEDEYTAMVAAEVKMRASKAITHDLRSALSGYQSLLRAVQEAYGAADQAYGGRR